MVNPIIKQQYDKSVANFSGKLIVITNDSNQGNSLLNVTGMCFLSFSTEFEQIKIASYFQSNHKHTISMDFKVFSRL